MIYDAGTCGEEWLSSFRRVHLHSQNLVTVGLSTDHYVVSLILFTSSELNNDVDAVKRPTVVNQTQYIHIFVK